MNKFEKLVESILVEGKERDYLFLGRMHDDIMGFLDKDDFRYNKSNQLMMQNLDDQFKEMEKLWKRIKEKPEWLSMDEIKDLEKQAECVRYLNECIKIIKNQQWDIRNVTEIMKLEN